MSVEEDVRETCSSCESEWSARYLVNGVCDSCREDGFPEKASFRLPNKRVGRKYCRYVTLEEAAEVLTTRVMSYVRMHIQKGNLKTRVYLGKEYIDVTTLREAAYYW